jgi:hypothetical protein
MEIAFDAIGLEVTNEKAFNNLVQDAGKRGEASRLARKEGVLHGRCWRLGEGLEVWTVLYESQTGEVFYADCRPGFRARFTSRINPWVMTEFDREGEARIHGFIEDTEAEVLFELQNLTEVGAANFQQNILNVGLCGLAYQAKIIDKNCGKYWRQIEKKSSKKPGNENDWSLCGEIIAFNALRNPFSGSDLFWLHLELNDFELEVLVNQRNFNGENLHIGAMLQADVWLQGHIVSESTLYSRYEGVDYKYRTVDFWKKFKKLN